MSEEVKQGVTDNRGYNFAIVNKSLIDEAPESNGITKPSEIAVFCALARYANNDTRQCFPRIKQIAEKARVSPRTAKTALRTLRDSGYILIEERFHEGTQQSNLYTLLRR